MMIELQTRRELFVDNHLLEALGGARLKLWEPRVESIPTAGGKYNTVIHENGVYRLYYRQKAWAENTGYSGNLAERVCYSESRDGYNYTPVDLGTAGGRNGDLNNVIYDELTLCHNFSPFIDTRAGVPADERYKAISGIWHNNFQRIRQDGGDLPEDFAGGLYTFASADGLNWRRTSAEPVITCPYKAFDSQNVAFWSVAENCFVCYFRTWGPGGWENGLRGISKATSPDFVNWTAGVDTQANVAPEELYTSQTAPYFRAPHIYLAFPTRYMRDRDSSTDIMFMSSRGGASFDRTFRDPLLRPGLDPERWTNRANYASVNLVPLDAERMCIYVFTGVSAPSLMLQFRTDGVASLAAGWQGAAVLTRPLSFTGTELEMNYSTTAAGSIRAEIIGTDGLPLPGFTMDDCETLVGDEIAGTMNWRGGSLDPFAGTPVRLRLSMLEADIFSLRFRESAEKQS